MIHLHETATTEALDVATLRAAIGPLLQALRDLDVTAEGVRGADRRRRPSLRLTDGRHPEAGATYRVVESTTTEVDGETVERTEETDVEVLSDTAELVSLQAKRIDEQTTVAVSFEPAVDPTTCTVDVFGPLEASVSIDLDHLPLGRDPQVEFTALHRYFAAEGTITVTTDATGSEDRWTWTFRVEARGRTYMRPVASVAWLFLRRRVRAEIDTSLAPALTDTVDQLNALLAELAAGPGSIDDGAGRAVDAWVEHLPVS